MKSQQAPALLVTQRMTNRRLHSTTSQPSEELLTTSTQDIRFFSLWPHGSPVRNSSSVSQVKFHPSLLNLKKILYHHLTLDESLLQSKPNKHLLESFEQRVQNVRDFLTFIKPQITYDLIRIYDLYGPTELDPDIQVVMVSKETLSSADPSTSPYFVSIPLPLCLFFSPVVRRRAEKHLPPLHIFFTDVISATSASLDHDDMLWLKENKLSSTYIRQWIVDREREKEAEEGKISTL